jgi:hypothetical protein
MIYALILISIVVDLKNMPDIKIIGLFYVLGMINFLMARAIVLCE